MAEDEYKMAETEDKGATFDMYHFFSRKDVLLAGLVVLFLLIYAVYRLMSNGGHVI